MHEPPCRDYWIAYLLFFFSNEEDIGPARNTPGSWSWGPTALSSFSSFV